MSNPPLKTAVMVIEPGRPAILKEVVYRSRDLFKIVKELCPAIDMVEHVYIFAVKGDDGLLRPRPRQTYRNYEQSRRDGVRQYDMFVDESGLLRGLTVNEEASRIYNPSWGGIVGPPVARVGTTMFAGMEVAFMSRGPEDPYIAGPAVIFTERKVWR